MSKGARRRRGGAKRASRGKTVRSPRGKTGKRRNNGWFRAGQVRNPDGRPRSARRVLNDDFIFDMQEAWRISGKTIIEAAIAKHPDVFLYANSAIVPPELRAKINGLMDMDAEFGARVLAACAEMKAASGADGAQECGQRGKLAGDWNRLAHYRPYPKQIEFHAAGAEADERLLMAGNQVGKTLAGGMEWAMHLTGRYPDWWRGRVFDAPVRMWAAGVTAESTRDNPQRVLIGTPQRKETWGSGTIPKDAIKDWRGAYHLGDALDSVVVRWGGGGDVQAGESVLAFKSYEKGREKWQGETLDGVWFDEEPPLDIYCEGRTRCVAKRGIVMVTFTPLLGMSEVVKLFLGEADLMTLRQAPNGA